MQQASQLQSVSDLYGADEIDFLLDEIRDFEPACCQIEDILVSPEDFESSRAGDLSLSYVESPLGTCSSWDSHLHYREQLGNAQAWGVALHCDTSHLKTRTGIVRILLVISSAVCLACECSAGTVQVGLFLLPLIGRLRLMVFCALFSLLVTCLMLFLDISHIALMFPFNWGKLNAWLYLTIGLLFILGSSLLVHMVFFAEEFYWVPKYTKDTLFVSALIGYICALEALLLAVFAYCPFRYRTITDEFSELHDRELSPLSSKDIGVDRKSNDLMNHHDYQKIATSTPPRTLNHSGTPIRDRDNLELDLTPMKGTNNNKSAYTPVARPDQSYNQKPTLGNTSAKHKNRQGYHYQPVASTSRQSPTFILGPDDDELIIPIDPNRYAYSSA